MEALMLKNLIRRLLDEMVLEARHWEQLNPDQHIVILFLLCASPSFMCPPSCHTKEGFDNSFKKGGE